MLERFTARPRRCPRLSDVLAPGAVALGVVALTLASDKDASPVLWVIVAVLLGIAGRQAYWAYAYRHVSDEAIAMRTARPDEAPGFPGVPAWKQTAGRWLPHRLEAGRGWGGLSLLVFFTSFWCLAVDLVTFGRPLSAAGGLRGGGCSRGGAIHRGGRIPAEAVHHGTEARGRKRPTLHWRQSNPPGERRVVKLDLGPEAAGRLVKWLISYQRVASPDETGSDTADLEAAVVLATGTLAP